MSDSPPTEHPARFVSLPAGATQGLREAVESGNRREALGALADFLAEELVDPHEVLCKECGRGVARAPQAAAVAKQLRDTLADIAALPDPSAKEDAVDEVARRRAARLANAAALPPAAGGDL